MKSEAVSVIVERKVLPGKEIEFERLLKGIILACSQHEGYLGTHVTKPTHQDNTYQLVFRYDSQQHLNGWIDSAERKEWVNKIDQLLEKPTTLQYICGLETWFTLPGQSTITPPPRYKMAVVSFLAITPLLICFNYLFSPVLSQLPLVPRQLLTTPWIVLIMTYLWMPLITKVFRPWLYPQS